MERHAAAVARLSTAVARLHARQQPFRIWHGSTNSTRPRRQPTGALSSGTSASATATDDAVASRAEGGSSRPEGVAGSGLASTAGAGIGNATTALAGRVTEPALVDISELRHVLAVDAEQCTCEVEPNVGVDAVVAATLRHGLVPPVVVEFPGITAGGAFAGTAAESSSFRWGFWDDNVEAAELMLADGRVVEARKGAAMLSKEAQTTAGTELELKGRGKENKLQKVEIDPQHENSGKKDHQAIDHDELLRAAAGSVGSIAIATRLTLRLVPARRFVRVTYTRTRSIDECIAAVRAAANEDCLDTAPDFVDGILFSPTHGVCITGRLTDELPSEPSPEGQNGPNTGHQKQQQHQGHQQTQSQIQTFSGRWDPWFYQHAESVTFGLNAGEASPTVDTVPLAEYLFRYDRGGFWVGLEAFRYFGFPCTRLTRAALDDFLHTRMLYRALHASGQSRRLVVQDVAVPYASAADLVRYVDTELAIWPLWLCPLKQRLPPTFHPYTGVVEPDPKGAGAANRPQQMLNIGIWGRGPDTLAEFVATNRALEHKVHALGGRKWLYAHTYYTEDEFWSMYDRKWYTSMREKYSATTLPTVYDKVKVDVDEMARAEQEPGLLNTLKRTWPFAGFWGIWKSIESKDYFLHRNAEWKYKK